MTDKQIKAAKKMLATLKRTRKNLLDCGKSMNVTLEQVQAMALESNSRCVAIIEEQLRLHRIWNS
jgi:hypothetical protein